MADHSFMFQYLKEKIDKGFPKPKYPFSIPANEYLYVPRHRNMAIHNPDRHDLVNLQTHASCRVALFFDGPFFPIRNGACYTIHNLMRTLSDDKTVDVNFFNCYRGWDEIDSYYDRGFNTTFLNQVDYYTKSGVLERAILDQGIQIAHFFDTEVLVTIAPRLQKLGVKVLLETQNIDHVLLERLEAAPEEIERAKAVQEQAIKMADYNLFRSDVDLAWGLELGARTDMSSIYKGGIRMEDFTFSARTDTKKLVFLGHMFYQPNENALHALISQVLPKLSEDSTLTIVGITPPKLLEKYKNVPNVVFLQGVDDLDATLSAYDIALAPLHEASGTRLKLLDYLASGLPVIATSLACEGLDPEITSYMTIENDLGSYASRIDTIARNIGEYQERSRQGRQYVKEMYDWPACIQPFLEAYRSLVGAK